MPLNRLLAFLEEDPTNLSLMASAAQAAFDAGQMAVTRDLVARHAEIAEPPPELRNLAGVAAMREGLLDEARGHFEAVLAEDAGRPETRFNLAWTLAALGDWTRTSDLIDRPTADLIEGAGALKVRALHHLSGPEDALAWGMGLAEGRPDDTDLMGALSVAAMDAEDTKLAGQFAARAGERDEGLATLGMLRLDTQDLDGAEAFFDRALAVRTDNARALLGRGLAQLARGDAAAAQEPLDRGAAIFGDHLGSWVAAGWAHFIAGDAAGGRQRFETALELDDTFAETHGGLAVLDIVAGDLESARRRTDVALRLDRACLSGILARSMLIEQDGDPQTATRLRDAALNRPLTPGGPNLMQMAAALGAARGKRRS